MIFVAKSHFRNLDETESVLPIMISLSLIIFRVNFECPLTEGSDQQSNCAVHKMITEFTFSSKGIHNCPKQCGVALGHQTEVG